MIHKNCNFHSKKIKISDIFGLNKGVYAHNDCGGSAGLKLSDGFAYKMTDHFCQWIRGDHGTNIFQDYNYGYSENPEHYKGSHTPTKWDSDFSG